MYTSLGPSTIGPTSRLVFPQNEHVVTRRPRKPDPSPLPPPLPPPPLPPPPPDPDEPCLPPAEPPAEPPDGLVSGDSPLPLPPPPSFVVLAIDSSLTDRTLIGTRTRLQRPPTPTPRVYRRPQPRARPFSNFQCCQPPPKRPEPHTHAHNKQIHLQQQTRLQQHTPTSRATNPQLQQNPRTTPQHTTPLSHTFNTKQTTTQNTPPQRWFSAPTFHKHNPTTHPHKPTSANSRRPTTPTRPRLPTTTPRLRQRLARQVIPRNRPNSPINTNPTTTNTPTRVLGPSPLPLPITQTITTSAGRIAFDAQELFFLAYGRASPCRTC